MTTNSLIVFLWVMYALWTFCVACLCNTLYLSCVKLLIALSLTTTATALIALQRVTNIVFMGMGEPLLNLPSVLRAHEILNKDLGVGECCCCSA